MNKLFKINDNDNVAIALESLAKGEKVDGITLLDDIPFGHKVLLKDMKSGENIIKYNEPIGHLTRDCKMGEHIHEHNLKTNLSDIVEYKFGIHWMQYKFVFGREYLIFIRNKENKILKKD